jgi:hypothetical protein
MVSRNSDWFAELDEILRDSPLWYRAGSHYSEDGAMNILVYTCIQAARQVTLRFIFELGDTIRCICVMARIDRI